jgi:RecA-family ATPase
MNLNFVVDDLMQRASSQTEAPQPIPLSYFDECSRSPPAKHSLIKGVAAKGETLSLIGPPGSGKSALITDIVTHIGAGQDWRGYRTKAPAGVVMFAFERADLVKRRLAAYAQRGYQSLPIAVAGQVLDLMNPACVDTVMATIRSAEERFGCEVGYIAIDTYAKGIAAGNGDEDKARDQNRVLANMRRVHEKKELHSPTLT